jgi:predicted alpha/beta-fold hydrolase
MSLSPSTYRAPWWLPGGHAQTLVPALLARGPAVTYRRERWETPDADFIDVDWAVPPALGTGNRESGNPAPLVVLFHGLEGSSDRPYARSTMQAALDRGWRGVVVHFRGCSGEANRLPRAYHSGDIAEAGWILVRMRTLAGTAPLFVAGISLGGNMLLKWLGEHGESAGRVVTACAAVSSPVDLAAAGDALALGFNRLYTANFLRTMKRKTLAKRARFPDLVDWQRMAAARNLREFDDAVTAPLHGFRDVNDYWTRASAKPVLGGIRVPTLMLNALNDPFLPARALPQASAVSPAVRLEYPAHGGHVGFLTDAPPWRPHWLPHRLIAFFADIPVPNASVNAG